MLETNFKQDEYIKAFLLRGLKKAFWILNVLAPLSAGTAIYLLYRPTTLLVFQWLDYFPALKQVILIKRLDCHDFQNVFAIYSLPTGLWSYSALTTILGIWKNVSGVSKYFWIACFLLMIYFSELGQLLGVIPGTFDLTDLLTILISTIFAFYFNWEIINDDKKKFN